MEGAIDSAKCYELEAGEYLEVALKSHGEVLIELKHARFGVLERRQSTPLGPRRWRVHRGPLPRLPHGFHFQVIEFLLLRRRLSPWRHVILILDLASTCHPIPAIQRQFQAQRLNKIELQMKIRIEFLILTGA